MTALHELTIGEACTLLDKGEITSVELTQAMLDRIVAVDNQVRAFLAIDDENALEQARAADDRRATLRRGPSTLRHGPSAGSGATSGPAGSGCAPGQATDD